MVVQSQSQMITASLLLAQTNAARAEVQAQKDDSTGSVADLRRERVQARQDYLADAKDRYDAREIITNTNVEDDVNLVAERYRQKAQELMKALVKLSQEGVSAPAGALQDAAEPDGYIAISDFVLANINTIRPQDARLRLETEYVEYATGSGNDAVSVRDDTVSAMRTGDGSDAVSITADKVYSVHTDADRSTVAHISGEGFGGGFGAQRTYSNADSISISARDVQDVRTGGGADAIAIQSRLIYSVHAGSGDDAIALSGGLVEYVEAGAGNDSVNVKAVLASGINGGDGNDTISVDVEQGDRPLSTTYIPRLDGAGGGLSFSSITNADVEGGAGNDTMYIRADRHISVDAGAGDDRLYLDSGTVALKYRNGDGQDVISLGDGVSVLVDLDRSARFNVRDTEAGLTVSFEDGGSLTFEGLEDAANLILRNGEGVHVLKRDGAFDTPSLTVATPRSIDLRV